MSSLPAKIAKKILKAKGFTREKLFCKNNPLKFLGYGQILDKEGNRRGYQWGNIKPLS
jgi:hypothetical protein